jgi:hypothetical protein
VYTRKGLVDPPENWLGSWTVTQKNALEWWLAQYHIDPAKEHPGPPTLPNGVLASKVILHQTNDTLPPPPGGAGSKSLDRDRWQLGDVVAMYSYINANWGAVAPPNPPAPIPPVQPLKTVKVTGVATYLNVRALPNGADLGELYKNTVVPVVQESGDWYRIDGWIHTGYVTDV